MIHVDNHSVYESAKILRDKYVLQLDNGKSVYLDFFGSDVDRNIYQVTHQVTMDKAHKDDVVYKNRYDVTILINGLPIVQIELEAPRRRDQRGHQPDQPVPQVLVQGPVPLPAAVRGV